MRLLLTLPLLLSPPSLLWLLWLPSSKEKDDRGSWLSLVLEAAAAAGLLKLLLLLLLLLS